VKVEFLESQVFACIWLVCLATLVAGMAEASEVAEFDYATPQVVLTGRLAKHVFVGPPNYRSIRSGDRSETYWILLLTQPITVKAPSGDPVNQTEQEVRELQLVFTETEAARLPQRKAGKLVAVTGRLFSAHSGHHHTRVLLEVREIKP